jgi:hypothetical protein
VTPVLFGTLGTNGWYVSNVTLNWVVADPDSPIRDSHGCDAVTLTNDTVGTQITCSATSDGGTTTKSVTIRLDKTAPLVTATPGRAPDSNGWYNHALTVTFTGTDATSGVDACSAATYAGPDNVNASLAGNCRDKAGNTGLASLSIKYDATAPELGNLRANPGIRSAELHWKASADTRSLELLRSPGLKGAAESVIFRSSALPTTYTNRGLRPGRQYLYRLNVADEAGNTTSRTLGFLGRGALFYPAPGALVTKPPLLVWAAAKGASYYNVVVVRGRRVYSAWPVRTRLQLARSWSYRGRRYKLRPGLYRWYVWPGIGPLSAGRYGTLLGGSTFRVVHRS